VSKETYKRQKRPIYGRRDLHKCVKRDPNESFDDSVSASLSSMPHFMRHFPKETYTSQKRSTHVRPKRVRSLFLQCLVFCDTSQKRLYIHVSKKTPIYALHETHMYASKETYIYASKKTYLHVSKGTPICIHKKLQLAAKKDLHRRKENCMRQKRPL